MLKTHIQPIPRSGASGRDADGGPGAFPPGSRSFRRGRKAAKGCIALVLCVAAGCAKHEKLPAQDGADVVTISTLAGAPALPVRVIRDKAQVTALVSFVNSLPDKWSIPWYGASVGQVYFEFISGGKSVGTFCVGQEFFGRVAGKAYSQGASRGRIEDLGKVVGLDLWSYLRMKGSGQSPEPTPAVGVPAAPATPAGAPTRHP
jgi:hypothetical protein